MNRNNKLPDELPSIAKLMKSTILAIILAAIILVTVVLPAEYGVDPIGVGRLLGLTNMGEIKASLAEEAVAESQNYSHNNPIVSIENEYDETLQEQIESELIVARSDTFTFTLLPNEGKEIKFTMQKGSTIEYTWATDGAIANYDTHADSKNLEIKYHNYEKGKLTESNGILTADFDGNHGWFWRNRNSEPLSITLNVTGDYTGVVEY